MLASQDGYTQDKLDMAVSAVVETLMVVLIFVILQVVLEKP